MWSCRRCAWKASKGLSALLIAGLAVIALGPAAADHTYTAEHFSLTVDGVACGSLRSVEGGGMSADVLSSREGGDPFEKKQLAHPRYNAIELQLSFAAGKPVYDWINASWKSNPQRRSGSIVGADANGRTQWETQFQNALLLETTIPALDASTKEPGYLTLAFLPERVAEHKGPAAAGAAAAAAAATGEPTRAKQFIVSNFRLELDGLDCTRVARIDPFTVKQEITTVSSGGEAREPTKVPGKLQFPNLVVTLAASGATAETWQGWAGDFVIAGRSDDRHEKNGTITLLGPDLTSVVARIRLHNVGICRFERTRSAVGGGAAGVEAGQHLTAELYIERMDLEAAGAGEQDRITPVGGNKPANPPQKTRVRG
jgi:phage tail-like protein